MKTYSLVFSLVFFVLFIRSVQTLRYEYDPLLVVVIMVKNEETVMRATLQPFVDGGVDSFFVFDTGSTDNTIAVTEEFFAENGIEQCIYCARAFY